jgi:hypothetical protein
MAAARANVQEKNVLNVFGIAIIATTKLPVRISEEAARQG